MSYMRTHKLGGRTRLRHDARTIPLRGKDSHDRKEHGRYVRCWKCGFICDTQRDDLGGPQSRAGDGQEFYYSYYPQSSGSDRGVVATLSLSEEGVNRASPLVPSGYLLQENEYLLLMEDDSPILLEGADAMNIRDVDLLAELTLASYSMRRGRSISMLLGPDGSEAPIMLTYASKVTGGCPFCGSRNYAGYHR